MPIYEYRCKGCGKSFEEIVTQAESATCPACGGKDVERQLSAPGRVGVQTSGGGLQCGRDRTCCGSAEPCSKPGCHK